MKISFCVKVANLLVILFIVLMVFALGSIPFLVYNYYKFTGTEIQNANQLAIFLYLTALPFTVLLFAAKKVCKNILRKEPFCESNIRLLNLISICAFIDFLQYAGGTIVNLRNLLSLTLMVAAFMVGLTSLVLSQLVRYAMEIKQENDLTI